MDNSTQKSIRELKEDAYSKVKSSWSWLKQRAEDNNFEDDYILKLLGNDLDNGIMPIAEIIMALFNPMEEEYRELKIGDISDELLVNLVNNLVKVYEEKGFSGKPYIIATDIIDPPFTDAVCYLSGSLNYILRHDKFKNDERCKKMFYECLNWLINAKITSESWVDTWTEIEDLKDIKGAGWSYTGKHVVEEDKFSDFSQYLQPQTYFTSQVLTTLLEMFFDSYDLIEQKGLVQKTLDCIIQAKKFLTTSLFDTVNGDFGWVDFPYHTEQEIGFCKLSPERGYIENNEIQRDISLYPLESLSYIRYYQSDNYYKVIKKVKTQFEEKYLEMIEFSEDILNKLNSVFAQSLTYLNMMDDILTKPCRIQLHHKLNIVRSKNYLKKNDKYNDSNVSPFCYYFDGTVAYNCFNALTWFSEYFVPIKKSQDHWEGKKHEIIQKILSSAFSSPGFAHIEAQNEKYTSFYASRTAIACLLGWELQRTNKSDENTEILLSVKNKFNEILLFLEKVSVSNNTGNSMKFDANILSRSMKLAYLIGLIIPTLSESESNEKFVFVVQPQENDFDKEAFVKANGEMFFVFLVSLLLDDDNNLKESVKILLKQGFLVTPIRKILEKINSDTAIDRKVLLSDILDGLIELMSDIKKPTVIVDYY